MPTYDYHCETNDRTVQVQHRMSEEITTWGDLCARAGIDAGETPADAPVAKIFLRTATMESANRGSFSSGGSSFGAQSVANAYHTTKNF